MLLVTVKNLKVLFKQQQSFLTAPHIIRTIVRSTTAAASLRLLLHQKQCNGITDDGTIERLQAKFSARITLPETNTDKRVLTISTDSKEQCINVFKEFLPVVHEPPYPVRGLHDHQYEGNFLVFQSQIGRIVGHSGVLIKQFEENTNTKLRVYKECLPSSNERVVALGGSEEEIVAGVAEILDILEVSTVSGGTILYDPSSNDKIKHILVKKDTLATLIGRRGEGIKAIKKRCSALIDIDSHWESEVNQSLVSITGTPGQIRGAEYLFQQAARDVHSSDVQIIKMKVGIQQVRAIIGAEGEAIKFFQRKSGAQLMFEGGNERHRILFIEGSPDQIEHAQHLIQVKLEGDKK